MRQPDPENSASPTADDGAEQSIVLAGEIKNIVPPAPLSLEVARLTCVAACSNPTGSCAHRCPLIGGAA